MEFGVQLVKMRLEKRLHENICGLISIRDEGHMQAISSDLFMNKMKVNFDVFGQAWKMGLATR